MDDEEVFQEHVTVDLTGCEYVMEFWNRIKVAFDFPEYFGHNWDAFSDSIEGDCPAHQVTVIGANKLPETWKTLKGIAFQDMIRIILQKNKEFKARYNYVFDYELIDA